MATQHTHSPGQPPPATGGQGTMASAAPWYRFLSWWALLAGVSYLGLVLLFATLVLPTGSGSLPGDYLELVAAGRKPVLYRITIAFDVAAWLTLGGFLVAFAALFLRRALIRGAFIAALGVGAFIGFFGACLRLAGTADLGARYLTAAADQQSSLLASYLDQQRLVNVSFSAGGLVMGIAFVLAATVAWQMAEVPRAVAILFAFGGLVGTAKGALELATGADLGPLGLLEGILLLGGLFAVAGRFRKLARQG